MKTFEKLTVYCECDSPEHQFILVKDPDDGEMWMQVHLSQSDGFFKRLYTGLRYAFGYTSKYGDWDDIVLTKSAQEKIVDFIKTNLDIK
jgi:hypothetical protein